MRKTKLVIGAMAIAAIAFVITFNYGGCGSESSSSGSSAPAPARVISVTTEPATDVTQTTATLNGTITPAGVSTVAYFQWGRTQSYGSTAGYQNIGSGTSPVNIIANLTGLTPNTIYYFRIVASGGGSAQGVNRTFTTNSPVPALPTVTANSASNLTAYSAQLNGTVNPNGWNVNSCYFEYGDTESYGNLQNVALLPGSGFSPVSVAVDVDSLSPLTQYNFRLVATNAIGTSSGSNGTFTTLVAPPPPPPPAQVGSPSPSTGATGVSIYPTLSWAQASGATSYGIYFGAATSPPFVITNTGIANTTYIPGTLNNNTLYYWRIDSTNAGGTTTGIVWSFTTAAASPPAQVGSPSPSTGATDVVLTVAVSWATASGATSYNVYFGTDNPPTNINNGTNQTGLSYDPPGNLANGTLYYWRIDSVNAVGTTTGIVWSFTTVALTFNYTGDVQTWQVPTGVTSITVDCSGARGGSVWGGNGARVQTTLAVTPGNTLYIYVGGQGGNGAYNSTTGGTAAGGSGGWNGGGNGGSVTGPADTYSGGGGGGGGSDIRTGTALSTRIIIAGGGGGSGASGGGGYGGYVAGGAGGGDNPGGGGTQSAVGAGGGNGSAGSGGTGGVGGGGASVYGGGGGGGGYWGGGGGGSGTAAGGGSNGSGGGGGGGSGYSAGTGTTYTEGVRIGNGQIIITY